MTEKRYYILDSPHTMPFICDRLDNDKTIAEVHSDNVNQLCDLLNEQDAEIKRLEDELQNLQTFKKILEFAEKDMEERADWQAYCEKEFGGL